MSIAFYFHYYTLNVPLSPTGARKPSAPLEISFWQKLQTFSPFLNSSRQEEQQNCLTS